MAVTRSNSRLDVILDAGRGFINHKQNQLRDALSRHKVYRDTRFELSCLSDRELGDLGIPRSHIKRLAREVAYDS
jgi:uncharacterized protein YjiS (DUF1127 family)